MKKVVKRFADSLPVYDGNNVLVKNQKYTHWVECTDGTRKDATGEEIHDLWRKWINLRTIPQYEENGFTVFEFNNK